MSINTKMTAIADMIRVLRGTSGTMGLDAMASNLGTVQTDLDSAFTAVDSKGGTVPSSRVSGNLEGAIQSIPKRIPLQQVRGSFVPGSYGAFTIECGFKPDYVIFTQGKENVYEYGTYPLNTAAYFESAEFFDAPLWEIAANYGTIGIVYDISGNRTDTGVIGNVYVLTASFEFLPVTGGSFQYIAVKYTE